MTKNESIIRKTEKEVLAVYQKHNPSKVPIETSPEEFKIKEDFLERLFLDHLSFPPKMFKDADLLDLGAGTGEQSLFYQKWGARCTLVDMNQKACSRAHALFSRMLPPGADYQIINQSVFDYRSRRLYDIAISTGVIHHTADKEGVFDIMCRYLKPGGFLVLGYANKSGALQYNLQRSILYALADSEEEIVEWAEELFGAHLDRAEAFGRRDRKAIVYDGYVNTKIDCISISELMPWFKKNNIRLYSSKPSITPVFLGDSARLEAIAMSEFPHAATMAELFWLGHNRDDNIVLDQEIRRMSRISAQHDLLMQILNDAGPSGSVVHADGARAANELGRLLKEFRPYDDLLCKTVSLLEEVEAIIKLIPGRNRQEIKAFISGANHLFKGTSGLGMNYVIGYKHR